MSDDVSLFAKNPCDCTVEELREFVALVSSAEEVQESLLGRVKERGHKLVFLYQSDVLAGAAAIKRPYHTYRARVFRKARAPFPPEGFLFELGWIVVSKKFRGEKLAGKLIERAMNETGKDNIFATTRKNNTTIQRYLNEHDFVICGNEYKSDNRDEYLVLMTRK